MAQEREDILYRGHRIIANSNAAMIYPDKHKINSSNINDALDKAKDWINSKYKSRSQNRRSPFIGTIDDYIDAFTNIQLGNHLIAMLKAHKNSPGRKLTATKLAEAAGWPSYSSANAHYGNLAKTIAEHIGLSFIGREEAAWTLALATYEEGSNEWIMHDEVAKALEHLNIC